MTTNQTLGGINISVIYSYCRDLSPSTRIVGTCPRPLRIDASAEDTRTISWHFCLFEIFHCAPPENKLDPTPNSKSLY